MKSEKIKRPKEPGAVNLALSSSEVFRPQTDQRKSWHSHRLRGMATIPELMDGHITLEVECLDRLYLNGYIGRVATAGGLVMFMRDQLGKPIPSPVVLGQITEKFRKEGRDLAGREEVPVPPFTHKEKK